MSMFDVVLLFVAVGLQPMSTSDATRVQNHRMVLEYAEQTEPGITDQFKKACELTLAAHLSLRADIETFLVENQLA